MVRCTVTSLWRSRLAGGGTYSSINTVSNRLTFLFQDGATLTLPQNYLVKSLAEQHQAAPSEYQILRMLRDKLEALPAIDPVKDWTSTSRAIWRQLLEKDEAGKPTCVIDFDFGSSDTELDNPQLFYSPISNSVNNSTRKNEQNESCALILLPLWHGEEDESVASTSTTTTTLLNERRRAMLRVARKEKIPLVPGRSILDTGRCIDQEGATITMLQHLVYQGRLFKLLGFDASS